MIPHIPRLESFIFHSNSIPAALHNFHCHVPLLENLEIHISSRAAYTLDIPSLSGDLQSLRTLSLAGDMIRLPQKKVSSLRDFGLSCAPGAFTVTQILDFLESAPLLHTIDIKGLISISFDALPERIVTLGHLHTLIINADSVYCIFKHLHIPVGASVRMWARAGPKFSSISLPHCPNVRPRIITHVRST